MKFVKLHYKGQNILVNMDKVSDIRKVTDDKSTLYLNFEVGRDQAQFNVDETLDEIYAKMKGNGK